MPIRRAILSVSDKRGLADFGLGLAKMGVALLASGGTAKALRDAGLEVQEISDYTGFPEMLDGRVKTLHPKIHGGLLGLRDNPEHLRTMADHGIAPIDLVAVNLYPFEEAAAKPGGTLEEAIENIDIGGPSLLRSAAKNHRSVAVVVDPDDYGRVLEEMRASKGEVSEQTRRELAVKVYAHTSRYDAAIAGHLSRVYGAGRPAAGEGDSRDFPDTFTLSLPKEMDLRYGENPHQRAALYGAFLERVRPLHGKELSFNNVVDANAALALIEEFEEATVAIIKHTNPCGVGTAENLLDAYRKAFETDTQSPFGGIIVVNRPLDRDAARAMDEIFTELIIAPEFEEGVLEFLSKKKNRRLLRRLAAPDGGGMDWKRVAGGLLVQEGDPPREGQEGWKVVTKRGPTEKESLALRFGWRVAKHVKSNAIVYAGGDRTLGIGAGQMSRVDSAEIGASKAAKSGLSLAGCAVASDAFFPFRDAIDAAAKVGATCVIQPGGSVRDQEVIAAADEQGLAMVFTGRRHFKH
jgi:phosphoribosylaminoimidazolecarboxamide formyltransferase/IMP cyclohydrolase